MSLYLAGLGLALLIFPAYHGPQASLRVVVLLRAVGLEDVSGVVFPHSPPLLPQPVRTLSTLPAAHWTTFFPLPDVCE